MDTVIITVGTVIINITVQLLHNGVMLTVVMMMTHIPSVSSTAYKWSFVQMA